jgi:hypothetical protein
MILSVSDTEELKRDELTTIEYYAVLRMSSMT